MEGVPFQVTVPVYPVPAVTVVTGVSPVTGAVTPAIAVATMVVTALVTVVVYVLVVTASGAVTITVIILSP